MYSSLLEPAFCKAVDVLGPPIGLLFWRAKSLARILHAKSSKCNVN